MLDNHLTMNVDWNTNEKQANSLNKYIYIEESWVIVGRWFITCIYTSFESLCT